jgi:mRNA interferase RelE/StbE
MKYQVKIQKKAVKFLKSLNNKERLRIYMAIELLVENPIPPRARKISEMDDHYRIRVGDYRIIYQVFSQYLLIEVVRVGFRRDVYRKL